MKATKGPQPQHSAVLENAPRVKLSTRVGDKDKSATLDAHPVLVIGGRRDCGLSVQHPSISKIHCAVVNTGSAVFTVDFMSRGGTRINGERISVSRLRDGDTLQAGECEIQVSIERDAAPSDGNPFAVDQPVTFQGDEQQYELNQIIALIGRRSACDIALDDPDASLVHALVFHLNGHPAVCDLGSRGGTRLNDEQVELAWLNDGDDLQIGVGNFKVGWNGERRTDPLCEKVEPPPPTKRAAPAPASQASSAAQSDGLEALLGGSLPGLETTLATLHVAINASREKLDRQALDLQEVEGELAARKGELDQREGTLCEREQAIAGRLAEVADREQSVIDLRERAASDISEVDSRRSEIERRTAELERLQAQLTAEKSKVETLESDLAARGREIEQRAAELDAIEQTREETNDRFARQQSEMDAAQEKLASQRDELDAARVELDAQRVEVDSVRSELEASRAELAAEKSKLVDERTRVESDLATIEEYRTEIDVDAEKLQQSRGDADAAQTELTEARAQIDAQRVEVERMQAEHEKASAKLAARLEALERREEALEDREVELDEQTEDLKQESEQRQNLDEQLADAKSAIESVARMFTTDQYKQQADAMPAPDGPAAWLAAPDAANQSNENHGPPAEFEQLSDELKERYRILRRLSRKSDAEIIQQLLGSDGSQSANSTPNPQPDPKPPSSPEPAAAPNPEPKSKSKSKGKQNGKKAKKSWFS